MSLHFTGEHEWIRVEGDVGTVGISNHAQEALGDIVFVEVPEGGRSLNKGDDAAVVESAPVAESRCCCGPSCGCGERCDCPPSCGCG